MQPLGRKPVRLPSKTDCHPPRGFVNWWENIVGMSGKAFRRKSKIELLKIVAASESSGS